MKNAEKELKRATQIMIDDGHYNEVRGSRVSWRKKSSYRKPIKRRTSKTRRRELKSLLRDEKTNTQSISKRK